MKNIIPSDTNLIKLGTWSLAICTYNIKSYIIYDISPEVRISFWDGRKATRVESSGSTKNNNVA